MPTATQIITRAMHRLGYLEATESPSAADVDACFEALNDWVDALAAERVTLFYTPRVEVDLTSGQGDYTIGTGGNINRARPMWIEAASIIPDDTAADPIEIPIAVLRTVAEFQRIAVKSTESGRPSVLYYNHRWNSGLGTITLYPVPNVSTARVVLYVPEAITEFADKTTNYTFPPAWRRFLVTNLAVEIAPILAATVSPELAAAAADAKAIVREANQRPVELTVDPALTGFRHRFNILTGV